jgi:hypothetical protein
VNALESLLAEAATRRLGGAGKVTALTLGAEDVAVTVELDGQPAPVSFQAEGLRWSVVGADFRVTFTAARCSLPSQPCSPPRPLPSPPAGRAGRCASSTPSPQAPRSMSSRG